MSFLFRKMITSTLSVLLVSLIIVNTTEARRGNKLSDLFKATNIVERMDSDSDSMVDPAEFFAKINDNTLINFDHVNGGNDGLVSFDEFTQLYGKSICRYDYSAYN